MLCLFKMTYNLGQRKVDQLDHKYHKNTNTFPPNPWVQKCWYLLTFHVNSFSNIDIGGGGLGLRDWELNCPFSQ